MTSNLCCGKKKNKRTEHVTKPSLLIVISYDDFCLRRNKNSAINWMQIEDSPSWFFFSYRPWKVFLYRVASDLSF